MPWHDCITGNRQAGSRYLARLRQLYEERHGPVDWDGYNTVLRHLCDNPSCHNVDHVRLGTQAENLHDAAVKGRLRGSVHGPGGAHRFAKLTEDDVQAIRNLLAAGMVQREIAVCFNVSPSAISRIATGARWRG